MANKRSKEAKQWDKAKWTGFINVALNSQEKKQVKENLLTEEIGYEFLMSAATEGYKCSISYSIPEDVYTVSLTGQYREKPNGGLTISQRHRDLIVALSALAWCFNEDGLMIDWEARFGKDNDDSW
jgi:hypothetical protein